MTSGVPQLERDFCSHQAEEKPLKAHLCLVRSTALDFCVMKGPIPHAICCQSTGTVSCIPLMQLALFGVLGLLEHAGLNEQF